jgi:hypothetical protein
MIVKAKRGLRSLAVDECLHPGVDEDEQYVVCEVSEEHYRVWDRNGQPILYAKQLFDVVDHRVPSGWVFEDFADGEYHLQAAVASRAGFYEDYFGSSGDNAECESVRRVAVEALSGVAAEFGAPYLELVELAVRRIRKQ